MAESYPCPHRGRTPTGRAVKCLEGCVSGLPVLACDLHGECTYGNRGEGVAHCCRDCPDRPRGVAPRPAHATPPGGRRPRIPPHLAGVVRHADDPSPLATAAPPASVFTPTPSDQPCGVVVGCYGWPRLAELQVGLVRHTCGPVPILLANDDPESTPAFDALAAKHPDVFHWPNPTRIGHTGGDISAFFKGVLWGASRGLRVVAKLSQRFLIDRPRWLQDGAADLIASGLPLASRACKESSVHELRTEACLLDVVRWNRPAVLARLTPRKYWHDLPGGLIAETVVYRVLQDLLDGLFWPWGLLSPNRLESVPGVVWHHADGVAEYRRVAAGMGCALDADFHATRRDQELRAGTYDHG